MRLLLVRVQPSEPFVRKIQFADGNTKSRGAICARKFSSEPYSQIYLAVPLTSGAFECLVKNGLVKQEWDYADKNDSFV